MSKPRIGLQSELESLLGSTNVYFQPPENLRLQYPCIIYELMRPATQRADNSLYKMDVCYTVKYIHKNPDDPLTFALLQHFQYCSWDRRYASENLLHDNYTLYY